MSIKFEGVFGIYGATVMVACHSRTFEPTDAINALGRLGAVSYDIAEAVQSIGSLSIDISQYYLESIEVSVYVAKNCMPHSLNP